MAEPRSAAQEAADPSTSPERLLELTEKHPQLQRLILLNPSCPEVARQWILATNPWAKRAYEENVEAEDDAPTALHPAMGDEDTHVSGVSPAGISAPPSDATSDAMPGATPGPLSEPATEALQDPAAVSAWGDFGDDAFWGEGDSAVEPAPGSPTSSVRIARDASVVPLGPAPSPAASESPASESPTSESPAAAATPTPAPAPTPAPITTPVPAPAPADYPDYAAPATPGAYDAAAMYGAQASAAPQQSQGQGQGQGQSPLTPYGAAAPSAATTAAPPARSGATDDQGSRPSRRIWWACGGCLLLSLLLVIAIAFAGRAWLSADDDGYERDSSTTAQETPAEEPAEEPTEETPSQDPVSPAPDGAQEMTELRSPTGNIICLLEEDTVSCSVLERDFSESGLEDCENGPFSIQVAGAEAAPACGTSFLSDSATVLEYDQSATSGDVACTSRFDGMTCWNVMTGKGFMVNKATYETF